LVRRTIFSVLCITAVFMASLCQGGLVLAATARVAPSAAQAGADGPTELTQLRWALHTDAVSGATKLRLVFDVSDAVEAAGKVVATPTPRFVVTVKGAVPGKNVKSLDMDGKIVDGVSISTVDGQNTKIVIDMPTMVEESNCRVFTLKKDLANNKPNRIVVDVEKPVPPMEFHFTPGLKDKVIVIDPGHGGSDPGAIGPTRIQEKDVNLAVALKVRELLERAGAEVIMTRRDDRDVFAPDASAVDELKARTTIANVRKADVFVSIHSNSSVSRAAGGTETFYYQKTRYDALLAQSLQAGMIEKGNLDDRGTASANFYVIKRTVMPASLVELGFVSNPDEEKRLADPQFEQRMARGIVDGLEDFFAKAAKQGGER